MSAREWQDSSSSDNPILQPLGPYVAPHEWPARLAHDPLAQMRRSALTAELRDIYLDSIRDRFDPSVLACRLGRSVQRMVRHGYQRRNPIHPVYRRSTMQTLALRGRSLSDLSWNSVFAEGLMVKGCTGVGKSHALQRIFSLMPQVHVHGRSEVAGWTRQVQIVYLIVPMPSNRGGLLYAILSELDRVLGTDYCRQHVRSRLSIEKLAVEVGVLLVQHYVGVLVIEELQPRNFSASPYRDELLQMLLRLLNFGIPVILVGNPLAFVGLDTHSQDLRRLTSQEPLHFMPLDRSSRDWTEGLGHCLWSHNVMPEPTTFDDEISDELWLCCAGIPHFAQKAVIGVQQRALDAGETRVTAEHLQRYRDGSEAFAMCKDLVNGFATRDPKLLSKYLDVPWQEYGQQWGVLSLEQIVSGLAESEVVNSVSLPAEDASAYRSVHARLRTQFASQLTGQANRKSVNAAVRKRAGPEDLRSGSTQLLSAGVEELRRKSK